MHSTAETGEQLKVLSLNVRHGGGKRIPQICDYVEQNSPDVFVATEHRNRTDLAKQLSDLGYTTQVAGDGEKNTVLVAAKAGAKPLVHEPQRLVGLRFPHITILGTYFAQNNEKRALFEYLLATPPQATSLLIGDFNTGEHFKDENERSFYCADLFADLSSAGWVRLNSHDPTWYSHKGNGFCIDHAFVFGTKGKAEYDHSTRSSGLTDHSALQVSLELEACIESS